MKKLFKLALATCTAFSLFGSPLMTLANTDSDELKDELCEHYWFDKEDSKVYTFDGQGQWKAYDSSSQDINESTVDDTTPSDDVLGLTPETGDYDYSDGHITIYEEDDDEMNLDIIKGDINSSIWDSITDETVKELKESYKEDIILYDKENKENHNPADYMLRMAKIEEGTASNSTTDNQTGTTTSNSEANKEEATDNKTSDSEATTPSSEEKESTETPSSQTDTTVDEKKVDKIATSSLAESNPVYIAGNVYHVDTNCAGSDYKEVTLKQAVKDGYTPCEKEFSYDGYSFSTEAGKETKNTENNVNVNIEVINVENNVLVVNEANTDDATTTNEEDLVNVNGKIVWKDNKNEYKVRPSKVTVILYRNGEQYKAIDVSGDASSDSWSFGFEKLAKKDESGNEYKYTIKEKSLAYYRGDLDGYVLTNTYVGQAPTTSSGSHTGTQTNMTLYAGVGIAAVAVVIILIVMNKKKQAK